MCVLSVDQACVEARLYNPPPQPLPPHHHHHHHCPQIGNTCVDHGHHVVVWALTFDLVYYASEDKVAALGAQLAAAGAPEGLLDTLVRPLVDLVAAGRQHALARVTKILVDRCVCV